MTFMGQSCSVVLLGRRFKAPSRNGRKKGMKPPGNRHQFKADKSVYHHSLLKFMTYLLSNGEPSDI